MAVYGGGGTLSCRPFSLLFARQPSAQSTYTSSSSSIRLCPVQRRASSCSQPYSRFYTLSLLPHHPSLLHNHQCQTYPPVRGKQSLQSLQTPDRRRKRNPERPSQKAPSEQSRAAILAGFVERLVSSSSMPAVGEGSSQGQNSDDSAPTRTPACLLWRGPFTYALHSRNATRSPMKRVRARPAFGSDCNVLVSVQSDQTG